MNANNETGEKPADDSYSTNSKSLNQWGLSKGPNGDGSIEKWDVSLVTQPEVPVLVCDNRYDGHQFTVTQTESGYEAVVRGFKDTEGHGNITIPVMDWEESITLSTDNLFVTVNQLCQEYSDKEEVEDAHVF